MGGALSGETDFAGFFQIHQQEENVADSCPLLQHSGNFQETSASLFLNRELRLTAAHFVNL